MIVETKCYRCKKKFETMQNDIAYKYPGRKPRKLCPECRQRHLNEMAARSRSVELRQANAERMKKDNPMFKAEVRAKVASFQSGIQKNVEDYRTLKKDAIKETRDEMSKRMSLKNPMYINDSKRKCVETRAQRIKSGEIIYKRGPDHHLWKGNIDFNNSCRRSLYPVWVKPIMARDNFRCVKCNSTQELQVHHLKPLREIIQEVKNKHRINTFYGMTGEESNEYVQEVVVLHTLEMGITVCSSCHGNLDPMYFNFSEKDKTT